MWPLLPVLLPAIRFEEPRGDALKRQTLQMWILWPRVRWGYHTQQPHTHAHRGEAVQVSNREYPPTHPTHSLLLPAPCCRLSASLASFTYIQYGTQLTPFTYLLTPFLLPNNLPITCWHRSYKGRHFFVSMKEKKSFYLIQINQHSLSITCVIELSHLYNKLTRDSSDWLPWCRYHKARRF